MIVIWTLSLLLISFGTFATLRRLKTAPPRLDLPFNLHPISILKPLKGLDSGLEENLESFFYLQYPKFEIIFSVADAFDPTLSLVERLLKKYPRVKARVIIGQEIVGVNPKVNNLVHSYEAAKFNLILISDSNVRVDSDYLKRLVAHLDCSVGVITAVVAGMNPKGLGGELEAMALNSFYARGMNLAFAVGQRFVVGKSMLFRKTDLDIFGGIAGFGDFIAEDYKIGEAIQRLGLGIVSMCDPIRQEIGAYRVKDFWSRHIRWFRIRRAHAPLPFYLEFLMNPVIAGCLGAFYFASHCGADPFYFFLFHLIFCLFNDLVIGFAMKTQVKWYFPFVWLLREFINLPLLIVAAIGHTVNWRGHKLTILSGGAVGYSGKNDEMKGEIIDAISLGRGYKRSSSGRV